MDLRTVVAVSALLLVTAESDQTSLGPNANNTIKNCSCTNATPTVPAMPTSTLSSPAPALGLLTVRWMTKCEGDVNLVLYESSESSSPVCHNNETNIQRVLTNVCEDKEGCKDAPHWAKGRSTLDGYNITESGLLERTRCETLSVRCTVKLVPEPGLHGQLQAYKVMTALLCCVLLVLLLLRFTRPTVKALQKRLSDRRQNRWIGPTQSHSVSYHRGKTTVKNNDGEKRLSYPALERLTVSDSRESSSNRNSDYNF